MTSTVSEKTVAAQTTQKAAAGARKKATRASKAPNSAPKSAEPREGSKTAKLLDLLKRPGGATAKELAKATGWQPHSVRGFLAGTVRKKLRLTLTSAKSEDGERSYSVKV